MNKKIMDAILNLEDNMINFRRKLHQFPELSMQEYETTKRIAKKLDKYKISYRLTEPTGLIGEIEGNEPGPIILLRADIDALPIHEENKISYASKRDNVMHACGHDSHAAMLLAAAKILSENKDKFKGKIRLVFQPGEETGEGAKAMIEQGVLKDVDQVFGLHINSAWDIGTVYCPVGEMMAANDEVKIYFKGAEGHGARPNEGIDANMMAASFLLNSQNVLTKELSALDSAVINFGKLKGGKAANIVSAEAILEGSVRTFSTTVQTYIEESLERYAKQTANMYRGQYEMKYIKKVPSLINNEKSTHLFYDIAGELFGEKNIDKKGKKTGSEDFAYYMSGDRGVLGVFAFIGARGEHVDTQYNHHTNKFNIDESAMKYGVYFHIMYALNYLNK